MANFPEQFSILYVLATVLAFGFIILGSMHDLLKHNQQSLVRSFRRSKHDTHLKSCTCKWSANVNVILGIVIHLIVCFQYQSGELFVRESQLITALPRLNDAFILKRRHRRDCSLADTCPWRDNILHLLFLISKRNKRCHLSFRTRSSSF